MLRKLFLKNYVRGRTSQLRFSTAAEVQAAKPFSEIPEIPTVPILRAGWNYLPVIGKYKLTALHHASGDKYKEYGPIVREQINKDVCILHLFDPADIEKVFRHEGRYPFRRPLQSWKQYREERKDVYPNVGLAFSNGEEWHQERTSVQTQMMKPKTIHTYLGIMDEVARQFVDNTNLLRKTNGGEVNDYLSELYKWSLESVAVVALDARLGCLDAKPNRQAIKLTQIVKEMLEQVLKLEFNPLPLWMYFNTPMKKKFHRNLDNFNEIVHKYLTAAQNRLATLPKDHETTFLESLLSAADDPRKAITMVADLIMAGIDTTANTVGFTLYHLAKNQEAQEKAYAEVKMLLQDKGLTVEALNNMRYLKACVKESMRLKPVAIGISRKIPEDMVLRGYHIPAGTLMFLNGVTVGQMDEHFQDPDHYRPERFLRGESQHDPFAFLPFGFGPRSCIGRRIAEQEIWTLLIRILERFRVEYHKGEVDLITRLISTPDRPLDFQFFDR